MSDCIFCQVVAKALPSALVYEDAHVYAFLDIHPVHPGHVLVIPKVHLTLLPELSLETVTSVMAVVQRVGRALMQEMGVEGFNILQNNGAAAGQVIPHVHFHVVPRYVNDGLRMWPASSYSSEQQKQETCERLRMALQEV